MKKASLVNIDFNKKDTIWVKVRMPFWRKINNMKFDLTQSKKIILLVFILSLGLQLNAQEKVYFKQGIGKFEKNKNFYINKKVKDILKDLKVNFETVIFGGGWSEESNFIALRFNNSKDSNKLKEKGIDPAKLTLFIKEYDPETNKLFYSEKRKIISRDSIKNKSILKGYKELTILEIIANSEQPKIERGVK